METTPAGWTVIDREAGVLVHTYEFTKGATSTTFAARMESGGMLVISPCLDLSDALAEELLAFGNVEALVANNGLHYLGQSTWRERFPNARSFAPADAIPRIEKKSKVKLPLEPLSTLQALTGPNVHVREVPNTKIGESWCWAKIQGGYAWYVSDVLNNLPTLPKAFVPKMLFKLTKSAPGYKVFHLCMKLLVKDKKATLRLLLEDLEAHEPKVIVPAHGDILSQTTLAKDTRNVIEASL